MTNFTHAGYLPRHQYVWVEPGAMGDHDWQKAVWFGLTSWPGRAWGCHVMLECGAVYRNLGLHQIAQNTLAPDWKPCQAATWDAYGWSFTTLEYPFLSNMRASVKLRGGSVYDGTYLFTAAPFDDGFSASPEQSKEFYFIALDNGRFTAQPTNHVLIDDKSFCEPSWPKNLKRQTEWFSSEDV